MPKRTQKAIDSSLGQIDPYILEFERQALSLLKDDSESREKLREVLEEYAARYAEQSTSGT